MYSLDLFSRIVSDNNKNIGIVFNIKREKYFALLKLHLRALSTRQKSPKQLRIGKMILPKLLHASSKLVSWQVVRNKRPKNKFWGFCHTWFVFFKMKKAVCFYRYFFSKCLSLRAQERPGTKAGSLDRSGGTKM